MFTGQYLDVRLSTRPGPTAPSGGGGTLPLWPVIPPKGTRRPRIPLPLARRRGLVARSPPPPLPPVLPGGRARGIGVPEAVAPDADGG